MANKTTAPNETEARRPHTDKNGISEVWGEIIAQPDIDIGV